MTLFSPGIAARIGTALVAVSLAIAFGLIPAGTEAVTPPDSPVGESSAASFHASGDTTRVAAATVPPGVPVGMSPGLPAGITPVRGTYGDEPRAVPPRNRRGEIFDTRRINLLVILAVIGGAILFYTFRAQRGVSYSIRRIAGISAIEEAVGRATEMGKPVLFVPGIQDLDNIQTLAGLNILASVAGRVAEYDAHLEVPTARSLVMTTARETVKEAYLTAGRADSYNEDAIYYVTDEQFGYVAYLDGYMVRKKPATCIYMGAFLAESLILAETGYSVGAIQIAGTAMPTQLPFFVAACDYTLIGEELFAASAYLSQDPMLLGSLRGQDFGKVFAMFFILLGSLLATANMLSGGSLERALSGLRSLFGISP